MMNLEKKGIPKVRDPWTILPEYDCPTSIFIWTFSEYSANSPTLFDSYRSKKSLMGFLEYFSNDRIRPWNPFKN